MRSYFKFDCRIHFWYMSKNDAIHIIRNSNLNETSGFFFSRLGIEKLNNCYQKTKELLLEKSKQYYQNNEKYLLEQAGNKYRESTKKINKIE